MITVLLRLAVPSVSTKGTTVSRHTNAPLATPTKVRLPHTITHLSLLLALADLTISLLHARQHHPGHFQLFSRPSSRILLCRPSSTHEPG